MGQARVDFQDNFESGNVIGWSGGESADTENQLDVVHYTTLAGIPGMPMPYSGAYCLRAVMSGGTADAVLLENDFNINTTITNWVKFDMWVDPNIAFGADDNISIFEAQGGSSEEVFVFGIDYVVSTDLLKFGVGGAIDNATPTNLSATTVPKGKWFTVELKLHLVTASAAGDITLYITEEGQEPSETATLTKASVQGITITHGKLGIQDHLATSTGTILMDNIQYSGVAATGGARMYPNKNRFSVNRYFRRAGTSPNEQSLHLFVGQGTLTRLRITGEVTDATIVSVYDTDTSQTFSSALRAQWYGFDARGTDMIDVNSEIEFRNGCYVTLATSDGGNDLTEIIATISRAPNWFSDGNMRQYAQRRNLNG